MHARTLLALATLSGAAAVQADETAAPTLPGVTNPQISLILNGVAYADDVQGTGNAWLEEAAGILHAHAHDHEDHGGIEEGFNLAESEVVMSATVDPLFDAYANLAFGLDSVEVEEAYFTTRALPAGWQVKGGKFLSGFGYANTKHPHSWDFVDQNLPYLSLIGDHGINDTGVQVTWSPATDTWMQFGVEALQGQDQEKFGAGVDVDDVAADLLAELGVGTGDAEADGLPDTDRRGPQLYTGFFRLAPDLGTVHALQLGVSYALHKGHQEQHEEGDPVTDIFYADGEASLVSLEAVYKRAATGRYGKGALRVNAEYLALEKDLTVLYHSDPLVTPGEALTGKQDGLYVQGTYGIAPRWEAGLRYDVTGMTNEYTEAGVTTELADSSRVSAALTFRPSEYSAWRLQVADADVTAESGANERFTQVMLQFNMSLGAHGAHTF